MDVAEPVVEAVAGNPYRRYGWLSPADRRALLRKDLLELEPAWSWSTSEAMVALADAPFDSECLGLPVASLVAHCLPLTPDTMQTLTAATDEALRVGGWLLTSARAYEPDEQVVQLLAPLGFRPAGRLLHLLAPTAQPSRRPEGGPEVRLADAADAPIFRSFARDFYTNRLLGTPELDSTRVRQLYAAWAANDLGGRMTLNLMATQAGSPAGFLSAGTRAPDGADGEVALIDLIVVDGTRRRMGVGRALLVEAMRRLASQGVPKVELGVSSTNTAAKALYASLGFEEIGTSGDYLRWGGA